MKIIVDAYNVLHYLNAADRITDGQRKIFIKQLGLYARKKGHALVAVFDGGPVLFASCSRINGIMVCYSGPGMSADEFILKYIKEHMGHSMLLVSSDNELCHAAHFYRVESIKSEDFCKLFMQRVQQASVEKVGPAVKTGAAPRAIDELMMHTEVQCKVEDMESPLDSRDSKSDQLSKKERNRLHKLKKL